MGLSDEEIYRGMALNSNINCRNCKVGKNCDDLSWRRDIKGPIIHGIGVRGSWACIRLHSAHSPEDLYEVNKTIAQKDNTYGPL
jgi:hypothetical protein